MARLARDLRRARPAVRRDRGAALERAAPQPAYARRQSRGGLVRRRAATHGRHIRRALGARDTRGRIRRGRAVLRRARLRAVLSAPALRRWGGRERGARRGVRRGRAGIRRGREPHRPAPRGARPRARGRHGARARLPRVARRAASRVRRSVHVRRRHRPVHAAQHAASERDADGAAGARRGGRAVRVLSLQRPVARRVARLARSRRGRRAAGVRGGRDRPAAARGRVQPAPRAARVAGERRTMMSGNESLAGRVALVTGASRGIGKSIALALAAAGADVAVNYRARADDAQAVAAAIRGLGRSLEELGEDDFDRTLAVNLKSAFLCTQAVWPGMRARRWGRIVNVSSGAARAAGIVGPHYNASKAGMEGLTRGYAARLVKDGITVNAVAPSLIESDMTAPHRAESAARVPLGRLGTGEEVASAVLMLVGNAYMTGQTVAVNGGLHFN